MCICNQCTHMLYVYICIYICIHIHIQTYTGSTYTNIYWNSCSEIVSRVSLIVGLVLFSGSLMSVLFRLWLVLPNTYGYFLEVCTYRGSAPAVAQVTDKGNYTVMDYKHCAASVPTKAWETDYSAVIWQVKWCLHGLTPVRPLVMLTTKVELAPQQALPLSMAAAAVPGVP